MKLMRKRLIPALFALLLTSQIYASANSPKNSDRNSFLKISREELYDKVYGGWVGMLIGGLEGLPHEWKYKEEPRSSLPDFGYLPKGARSDGDNNSYSLFNLSAHFCTLSYGIRSPRMPNTANQLVYQYAHISVCCEPIQESLSK